MNTDGALQLTGILLGAILFAVFIGYTVLSFSEGKAQQAPSAPRRFAGIFSITLGVITLGAWTYLLRVGWFSFVHGVEKLWPHVLTELISALILMVAGFGMIRNWSRGPALFMLANGFLLLSTTLALTTYGNQGHPLLMNGVFILLTVISVYWVGLVYGWEHFVLKLDEPESTPQNKSDF